MTAAIRNTLRQTYMSFAAGWLLGSATNLSGHAYRIYVSSDQPANRFFSHLGSGTFRRELAVAFAVFAFTKNILGAFEEKTPIEMTPEAAERKVNLDRLKTCVNFIAAVGAGYLTNGRNFGACGCLMISFAVAHLALYILNKQ